MKFNKKPMKHAPPFLLKWEDVLEFFAWALVLILLNIWLHSYFIRWDLTADQRYTLSTASKDVLGSLEDDLYIDVYLDGEMNASFKRFRNSLDDILEQFEAYSSKRIKIQYTDPTQISDPIRRKNFVDELLKMGINGSDVFENIEGKKIQKTLFPGIVLRYGSKEKGVQLLKGSPNAGPDERINQSIEGLEFEIISALQRVSRPEKARIAVMDGYNTASDAELMDAMSSLSESYIVDRVHLDSNSLSDFDVLIVPGPKATLSPLARYRLDQYVMKGGRALFFIDKIQMNLDSIPLGGAYAFAYDLGMEDLLFKYGIRVNMDLVQDQQASPLLINVGKFGDQPNLTPIPWPYYPVLNTFDNVHASVKNSDAILGRFVSTLDTVKAVDIKKTPLIFTSKYTKLRECPSLISMDELKEDLDPERYRLSHLPVAYLLEGSFQSVYNGMFPPKEVDRKSVILKGKETKIIVVGDGDFISSMKAPLGKSILPLGNEPVSGKTYANKALFLQMISYLTDEGGIISTRTKSIQARPLDSFKLRQEKIFWQQLNILSPILLLMALGVSIYYLRKRKYTRNS